MDVLSAWEDGAADLDDPEVLDRATLAGRVVYTHDDFMREAHARQKAGRHFAGVIYVHQLKLSIGEQIEELELIANLGQPSEFADRVEYL